MIVLLVVLIAVLAVGIGLLGAMWHRDEPVLGVAGVGMLSVAGILGSAYGALDSI